MGKAAVAAAKAAGYSGAGTIEFIVDEDLHYYFLEMNTRLQVEHPITERVVGVDLVKEQIHVANNEVLALKQEELKQRGHAIECRIYAEDPDRNFMPSPGIIKHITEPHGLGVRCDGYVYEGYEIPLYYDPLISKLICWGKTRDEAIARMKRALYEYKITGVKTSIRLLVRIMDTPDFKDGKYNTHFIEKNRDFLFTMPPDKPHGWKMWPSCRFLLIILVKWIISRQKCLQKMAKATGKTAGEERICSVLEKSAARLQQSG